jgi:hypothetical protein
MPYQEVKRYTEVCDLQHDFEILQQRGFTSSLEGEGLATLLERDIRSIATSELADAERRLGIALANVGGLEQLATPLHQCYVKLLKSAGME